MTSQPNEPSRSNFSKDRRRRTRDEQAFSHSHNLSGGSPLGLVELTTLGDALKDVLTVLVELNLGDDNLGRSNAGRDGLTVGLLAGDTLDVDEVLKTVDGGDLALTALVGTTDNGDLVVLADGKGADLVG